MKLFDSVKDKEICSIVQKDGLKGYLYIEAYKKQAIDDILLNSRLVNRNRVSIVPLKEMVDAISYKKNILVGEFARIKSGKYRGDLVKILENYDSQVLVKAVPRINSVKKNFNPEEFRKEVIRKDDGYYFNRDFYKDGYLQKLILKTSLDFDVEPSLGELADLGIKNTFDINDKILVNKGDLKNFVGKVDYISGQVVGISHDGKKYEISSDCISKHFIVGEEVSYKNENGVLLKIDGNKAIIGVDNFTREICCQINDLKPPKAFSFANYVAPTRFRAKRDPMLNSVVRITSGKFKGLHGTVKDSHSSSYTIRLRSSFNLVTVNKNAIVLENTVPIQQEILVDENIGGKTPSLGGTARTPAFRTPSFSERTGADDAGTAWLQRESVYEGIIVEVEKKLQTVSNYENGIYTLSDGRKVLEKEVKFCMPSLMEKAVIMNGPRKGVSGFIRALDEDVCKFMDESGTFFDIPVGDLTKKGNA